MSGGTVPAGTSTYSGLITAQNVAETTTFADRYSYVHVTNIGPGTMFVTADGSTANNAARALGGGVAIPAGGSGVIANGMPLWYQSSRVIAKGSDNAQQESRAGQMANPGTTVSVISSGLSYYSIEGTG